MSEPTICACGHPEHMPPHPGRNLRCPRQGCGHGRFLALDKSRPCRVFAGYTDKDGYGRASRGRTSHKAAYEDEVRELKPGETLDHLCKNRACEAPWHLEPVSQSVNSKRRWGHDA